MRQKMSASFRMELLLPMSFLRCIMVILHPASDCISLLYDNYKRFCACQMEVSSELDRGKGDGSRRLYQDKTKMLAMSTLTNSVS
jgi:hypothetical protein